MGNGGIYPVTLTVIDTNGCQSAVTREVEIFDFFNVFIPNSFTPNNDGFNDLWAVYGIGHRSRPVSDDRFINRWGQEVYFETTDPEKAGWIGQSDDLADDRHSSGTTLEDGDLRIPRRACTLSPPTRKREIKGYINITR